MAENNKSLEDQIKEAELQRIKAETSRIEEEKLKIEEERKKLERKNNLPWYRRPAFFQALVAGIIAIPLIWFYVKEIAVPLYQSDNIKLKRDIEAATDSLNKREEQHKEDVEKYLVQLDQLQQKNADLDSISSSLAALNEKLLNQLSRTEEDREQLEKNYSSIKSQLDEQKQKIGVLDSQIKQQKQRAIANISTYLSENDVTAMIKRKGYYDRYKNPIAKGITHQYEAKTLNGDKVVIDHTTKLMWQQDGSGILTYRSAKDYTKELNAGKFAGYSDWRLPTLEEAMSLMERKKKNGDLYIDPVFDKTQRYIWTSDLYSTSIAWIVDFNLGYCDISIVDFNDDYVRAVRFKQSSR